MTWLRVSLRSRSRVFFDAVASLPQAANGRPDSPYDLPAGGKRLVQRAQGYRHTFVSGKRTVRDDDHTGELPDKLLR